MNRLVSGTLILVSASALFIPIAADTVVDDFTAGGVTISNRNGHSTLDYFEDPSILGGARELQTRDAWSGSLGGQSNVTVDTSNGGSVSFYGGGNWGFRTACSNSSAYGTAIGTVGQIGGQWFPNNSPNFGKGNELNLELTLDSEVLIDIKQLSNGGTSAFLAIGLLANGSGLVYEVQNWFDSTAVIAIPLSEFRSRWGDALTPALAADIDGLSLGNGACSSGGISDAAVIGSIAFGGGDSDGDGVPDADDVCPNTELGAAVSIGGIDSGIDNNFDPATGCSTADLVNEAADDCSIGARNHGQFVSCVARGLNSLKAAGIISGKERGALQSAAAQSDLP